MHYLEENNFKGCILFMNKLTFTVIFLIILLYSVAVPTNMQKSASVSV